MDYVRDSLQVARLTGVSAVADIREVRPGLV
jgi:hypothetical protein